MPDFCRQTPLAASGYHDFQKTAGHPAA